MTCCVMQDILPLSLGLGFLAIIWTWVKTIFKYSGILPKCSTHHACSFCNSCLVKRIEASYPACLHFLKQAFGEYCQACRDIFSVSHSHVLYSTKNEALFQLGQGTVYGSKRWQLMFSPNWVAWHDQWLAKVKDWTQAFGPSWACQHSSYCVCPVHGLFYVGQHLLTAARHLNPGICPPFSRGWLSEQRQPILSKTMSFSTLKSRRYLKNPNTAKPGFKSQL